MGWRSGRDVGEWLTYLPSEVDAEEPCGFEDEPAAMAGEAVDGEDEATMAASNILILRDTIKHREAWSGRSGSGGAGGGPRFERGLSDS